MSIIWTASSKKEVTMYFPITGYYIEISLSQLEYHSS